MSKQVFRAPLEEHEIDPQKLRRSVKPALGEFIGTLLSPSGTITTGIIMAFGALAFPAHTGVIVLSAAGVAAWAVLHAKANAKKVQRLPLRLPLDAVDMPDYSNPYPGREKYRKGEGAIFLGSAVGGTLSKGKEVWASFTDALTHSMILGGTGAGKTETLLSLAFNELAVGGGIGYIDAKAAPKLYGQTWVMTRLLGRDDDMRVLNFALGQEVLGKTRFRRSNTMQPFARGKAEALKEIPLSLMAAGSTGGSIFESNAKALMTALTMALVEMRDKGEIHLYPGDFVHYMAPLEFVALAKRNDFSPTTRDAIHNFLKSMGWKPEIDDSSKWGDFDRQYSYAQNYFLDTFSTMNNTYRHIFAEKIGDINMVDVILQRRVFVTLIPSLEKSKKELENIGRITLSVVRLATAVGLGGGEIMGTWRKMIDLGIANARIPFFLTIDEIAAILVEGLAEMFTQGRGLGMSCKVGNQDVAGVEGASEMARKEAQQILSNTKLKFFMTGDDPMKTKDLIEKLADETDEFRTQGYELKGMMNYYDTLSAQAQRVKRVNAQDIAGQIEGEWHLFFKGKIIRGQGFHAGGIPKDREYPLFVHHRLQVTAPPLSVLSARFGDLKTVLDAWEAASRVDTLPAFAHEAPQPLMDVFGNPMEMVNLRRELACAALYAWMFDVKPVVHSRTPEPVQPLNRPVVSAVAPLDEFEGDDGGDEEGIEDDGEPVMSLPGAGLLRQSIMATYDPDDEDSDDTNNAGDKPHATPPKPIEESIHIALAKPEYPSRPIPEKTSRDQFQASTRDFLATLKKK